ncbi:MAG: hypothetical protein PF549_02485, partial [Patescibacteria group bacterium]|nr:hypothetical protein [Patescibacteria group bacterium]
YYINFAIIKGKDFPMRLKARGRRIIEFVKGTSKKNILAKAKRLGLKEPLYEDALLFGEKYPIEGNIVFWHKPFRAKFQPPKVLVISSVGWRRVLSLRCIDEIDDVEFSSEYRFAFIREPKKPKSKKEVGMASVAGSKGGVTNNLKNRLKNKRKGEKRKTVVNQKKFRTSKELAIEKGM